MAAIVLCGKTLRGQIKALIYSQGMTMQQVVSEMNKSRPPEKQTTIQNISNKLTRGTIKFSEVSEIAKVLGGTLSWEPLDTGGDNK